MFLCLYQNTKNKIRSLTSTNCIENRQAMRWKNIYVKWNTWNYHFRTKITTTNASWKLWALFLTNPCHMPNRNQNHDFPRNRNCQLWFNIDWTNYKHDDYAFFGAAFQCLNWICVLNSYVPHEKWERTTKNPFEITI